MRFNKGQEEAIRHGEGPCMVLASPGSGKTLTIAARVVSLIEEKEVDPRRILVITFTRFAAREMKERFLELAGGKNYPVTFGTFHSIFYGILKCAYGLSGKNLMSEKESMELLRQITDQTDLDAPIDVENEEEMLHNLMQEIGYVKNKMLHLREFQSQTVPNDIFAEIFHQYEKVKQEKKKFDFDDMMVQCYALFTEHPEILKSWQEKFQYILIDEFQDINRIQYEVMRMLAMPENHLFVVGDDDQSIYGFRGAEPELMQYMKQEYPQMRTIPLTMNYRSTEFIVGAASRVIYHNESRLFKRMQAVRKDGEAVHVQEVKDEMEESRYVANEIRKLLEAGVNGGDIAVLYRANAQARLMTEICNEYQIPYETKEKLPNFYKHFIVKDMLAYMRLASGRRDRYLFLQVGNRPLRYISRSGLEDYQITFEDLRRFYLDKEWMQDTIDQFETDVRMLENMTPYAAIQYIRKRIGYDTFLKDYAKEHQIPWEMLETVFTELEERCKNYRSYDEFQAHVDAYTKELEAMEDYRRSHPFEKRDRLQLMTMHAAKGLEFRYVFLIHANEGDIPYQRAEGQDAIEEERRLFYVAVTRAKEHLTISYYMEKNGHSMMPSRFVKELLGVSSS